MNRAHCLIAGACHGTAALAVGLALIFMASAPRPAFGQWNGTNPVWTNSSVGIGTATPGSSLDLRGTLSVRGSGDLYFHRDDGFSGGSSIILDAPGAGTSDLSIQRTGGGAVAGFHVYAAASTFMNGNVGIGTASPMETLQVGPVFSMLSTGADVALRYNSYWTGSSWKYLTNNATANQIFMNTTGLHFMTSNTVGAAGSVVPDYTEHMFIRSDGNVGIGTPNPCSNSFSPAGCLLSVNGAVQAKEVVVNSGWSDYVFDVDYNLLPLSQVATYVKANHHLPDIPSAEEVHEKGVSLGDMQAKLLAKIEELTLHMIAAQRRNEELEDRIARLETERERK